MNINKTQAVETLMELEQLEKNLGLLKSSGSIKNIFRFRKLKRDLEPATVGVKIVEVNERDYLAARSRISKLMKK